MGNLCATPKKEDDLKAMAERVKDLRKMAAVQLYDAAQEENRRKEEEERGREEQRQLFIESRRLAFEQDLKEESEKIVDELVEKLTKQYIGEFKKQEEDEMAEADKNTEELERKLIVELMQDSMQEFAVKFSELAREARLQKDFGDQLGYIRVKEEELSKTLYKAIGKTQPFSIKTLPMRELDSNEVFSLLTQDNQINALIDHKHFESKGGIKGQQLLEFDATMAETHLNVKDRGDQILIAKYVQQHNPIARQVRRAADEDPYVINPQEIEDLPTNILILRYIQNAAYYSKQYRENAIKSIENRLEGEKIMQKTKLAERCQEAQEAASDLEEYQDALKGLLKAYQPFDIELFKEKIEISTKNCEKVKNKNIMLILGGTGAGKSTTIQWLCGSTMHTTKAQVAGGLVEYIGVKEYDSAMCAREDLEDVKIGPDATSCTSFIKVLTINNQGSEIILVDTPGLKDSRGCEVDTANVLGIVKASLVCDSILPILVLSNNIGDRGGILKDYAMELSKLFRNIEEAVESIKFLFTKLPDTADSQRKLATSFKDIYAHLNEDEKNDKNFMLLFGALIDAVKRPKNIKIVDPLQKLDTKLLDKLAKNSPMEPAGDVFNMTVSEQTKLTLGQQIDMHNHLIEHVGLKQGKYDIIKTKLDDFKFLQDTLKDVGFITQSYKKAVGDLKNYIKEKFEKSKLDFEECLTQTSNVLTTSILKQALHNVETMKKLVGILKPTHNEILEDLEDDNNELDQHEAFINILLQTTEQLVNKITSNKFAENLASQEYLKNLESLRNIKDVFQDLSNIEEMVNEAFTSVKSQCIQLVNSTNQAIEDISVEEVCKNTLTVRDIQNNLSGFELGIEEEVVNNLKVRLFNRIEKEVLQGTQTLFDLVKDREFIPQKELNSIFSDIQQNQQVLSEAANSFTLQKLYETDQFKDLYEQLKIFIDDQYKEKMDRISEFVFSGDPQEADDDTQNNQDQDIQIVQSLLPGMNMCQQIDSKLYQVLSAQNRSRFIQLVKEISNTVAKITQEMKQKFQFCMDINSPEQAYQMVQGLGNLRRLEWFDQFQKTSQISNAIEETENDIQQYITSFSDQASDSYYQQDFKKLSTCLLKLAQLGGTSYKSQVNQVKELYQEHFKQFTADLDLFSDTLNGQPHSIPQHECEQKLQFFENFTGKFEPKAALSVANQISESQTKYTAVLRSACKSYYSINIDASSMLSATEEDVQAELDKLHDLKVMDKKSPLLSENLKALELSKCMAEELAALVESCNQSQRKLKQLAHRQQQEALFEQLDKFRILDAFIDPASSSFKTVRKELADDIFEAGQGKFKQLIENLEDDDFNQARYSFDALDAEEVVKGKSRIEKRINFIVNEIDQQASRVSLVNQLEFYHKCGGLSKKVTEVIAHFGPSPGEEAKVIVEPLIIKKLEESKKHLASCINVKIDRRLDRISEYLQDNEFNEVMQYLDFLLDEVKGIIPDLISPEVSKKAEDYKDEFLNLVQTQIKQYETRPPKQFQTYPLKALIVKLEGVRNAEMKTLVFDLKENVKKNFIGHLEQLKALKLDLRNGLNNKEFMTIKLALKFLPDETAGEIQSEIEDFETYYETLKTNFVTDVKDNIINNEVGQVYQKLADLKRAGRFDDLAITEEAISAQIQTIVAEYKNLIDLSGNEAIISKLSNILTYEGKFDSIVSVGSAINEAQKLTLDSLEKSQETIETFIRDAGLTEAAKINQQRQAKIVHEVEFFYSMKNAFTTEDKSGNIIDSRIDFNFQELHGAIVDSLQLRERRNKNQIGEALDEKTMTKAIRIIVKEENMLDINNVLIRQSQLEMVPQTTVDDIKAWLKTKVDELLHNLTDPFANKQLMENYSYQKDKRQINIINHYRAIKTHSQLLKSFKAMPGLKSQMDTVQYAGETIPIDEIDDKFHEKLKASVTKEFTEIINKIENHHFIKNDKFNSETPKATAFMIDNLIEFSKKFKDDEPNDNAEAEEDQEQSINVPETKFGYTADPLSKIKSAVIELDILAPPDIEYTGTSDKKCSDKEAQEQKKQHIKNISDHLIILKKLTDNLLHFQAYFGEQTEQIIINATHKASDGTSMNKKAPSRPVTPSAGTAPPDLSKLTIPNDQPQPLKKAQSIRSFTCDIKDLMGALEGESETCTFAASLLRDHPIFITERNAQIRKLYQHGTIDQMITSLKENAMRDHVDTEKLEKAYETYHVKLGQFDADYNKYSGLLRNIKKPDPIKILIDELKTHKTHMKRWSSDSRHKQIPEIVAYIVAIIALHKAKDVIKTSKEEEIGAKDCLFLANTNQIIGVFRLLAIGFKDQREKITGSLLQVESGEGKSYLIAVTMAVLAFLDSDVTCLCQNDYLRQRNKDQFQFLFELLDDAGFAYSKRVHYESIESFKIQLMDQSKDFTQKLAQTLSGDNSYFSKSPGGNGNRILLFDEVDLIFSEQYQEQTIDLSCQVKDDQRKFQELLRAMHKFAGLTKPAGIAKVGKWFSSVLGLTDDYLNLEELKKTAEYKECAASHNSPYKDYKELFDIQMQNVIYDVLKYNLETKEDFMWGQTGNNLARIYWKPDMDMSVQEVLNAFRFEAQINVMERMDRRELTDKAQQYIQIPIACGSLLISKEIKKNFSTFMGVSSCLEDTVITQNEKQLLKTEFGMEAETTVPSLFAHKALDFDPSQHLVTPADTEFMRDLAAEVESGLRGTCSGLRSVVLFCKDGPALQEMAKNEMFDTGEFRDNLQMITNWKQVMHIPESLANFVPYAQMLKGDMNHGRPNDKSNWWATKFSGIKFSELVVKSTDGTYNRQYTKEEMKENQYVDILLTDTTRIGHSGGVNVYIKQCDGISQQDYETAVKKSTMPGKVTFMMKELLFGTNFDVTSPEVRDNGGLHVIYVGWPDSLMEEQQAQRRHIQHGRGGTFKYVINEKHLMSYLSISEEEIQKNKVEVYEKLRAKIKEDQEKNFTEIKQRAAKQEASSEETSNMMKLVIEKSPNKQAIKDTLIKLNPGATSDELYEKHRVGLNNNLNEAREAQRQEQEEEARIAQAAADKVQAQQRQEAQRKQEIDQEYDEKIKELDDKFAQIENNLKEAKLASEQAEKDWKSAGSVSEKLEKEQSEADKKYKKLFSQEYMPKKGAFDNQQQKYLELKSVEDGLRQPVVQTSIVYRLPSGHEMEQLTAAPEYYEDKVICDACKKDLVDVDYEEGFYHSKECRQDYCRSCAEEFKVEIADTQEPDNAALTKAEAATAKEKTKLDKLEKELADISEKTQAAEGQHAIKSTAAEDAKKTARELFKEKDRATLAFTQARDKVTNARAKMTQDKRRLKNNQTSAHEAVTVQFSRQKTIRSNSRSPSTHSRR